MVTAFVPINDHPRSIEVYEKLGHQLRDALGDYKPAVFYETINDLWMTPWIESFVDRAHTTITHSTGDNPQKNSIEYHAVNHNKFEWLAKAAMQDQDADVFVWMDYGIMHQPGFNGDLVREFLRKVRKNDMAFPGCWPKKETISDYHPCWRFCGSLFVVPRRDVFELNANFKALTRIRVRTTRNVCWEVNDLAHMELRGGLSNVRWYEADHNAKMLTGY